MTAIGLRCLFSLLIAAGGSGTQLPAQAVPVPNVPTAAPISVAGRTGLPVIAFKRFITSLEPGDLLGPLEGGLFCANRGSLRWTDKLREEVQAKFRTLVARELEASGYPVAPKHTAIFQTETKPEEAGLELGVLLRTMKLRLCTSGSTSKGEIYFEATWALFNPRAQKVLLEAESAGSFQTGSSGSSGEDILANGIVSLTRNLLANDKFVAAVGAPLDNQAAAASAAAYSFPKVIPPAGGAAKNSTMLRAAVVTVESSAGSGSGFYISGEGYLLTNHHVIGDAKFVKVRTATGRELPGEVLSFDADRDVALVKTQKTPFDPLGLRLTDPMVGDEVFAIGSPLGDQFNGTFTRGVLSGFRDSGNNRFLQSDVSITLGSSGGPLVDVNGNVVGITVALAAVRGGNMNFFIPIADALTRLGIEIKP